jgi:hypothetical protein
MTGCRRPRAIQLARYPGQQVDVGLVLGQHHSVLGEVTELLAQASQHLLAVGVALGDQAGPTPGGDLRTRRRSVRWLSRGRPARGRSASPQAPQAS